MTGQVSPYDAIADDTRRRLLDMLRGRTLKAGEIARRCPYISRPAVSRHLAILRRARLVVVHRAGREMRYSLSAAPLREVNTWIRQYEVFWDREPRAFRSYGKNEEREK